jgi:ribose/xylose/arabinose/galactoside ABC-type transport system permease subunit
METVMPPHKQTAPQNTLLASARESLSHAGPVIVIYLVLLVMIGVLGVISPDFLSPMQVGNLFGSALPLVFAALAQLVIVLIKGIDLSVGSIISASGTISGKYIVGG